MEHIVDNNIHHKAVKQNFLILPLLMEFIDFNIFPLVLNLWYSVTNIILSNSIYSSFCCFLIKLPSLEAFLVHIYWKTHSDSSMHWLSLFRVANLQNAYNCILIITNFIPFYKNKYIENILSSSANYSFTHVLAIWQKMWINKCIDGIK